MSDKKQDDFDSAQITGQKDFSTGCGDESEVSCPKTNLVPDGGLMAHENAGGHLIRDHVGKTDAELVARLSSNSRISGSSSFSSRAVAEEVVSNTIGVNQAAINSWLSGSGNRLVISHNTGSVVGRSMTRGATSAVDATSVKVVLQRDSSLSTGYRIITGYPQ